jgi:hypothetical protein
VERKGDIRVLGNRKPYSGGLKGAQGFFELGARMRGSQPFLPKGVYRFKTYEEERAWTLKMLTRPRVVSPR